MKYVRHYRCVECNSTYPATVPMNLCPQDQRPVQMEIDVEQIRQDYASQSWFHSEHRSMWRFGPLLPFDISRYPEKVCSLNEGHTPLINISHLSLCKALNLNVSLKDEGQPHPGFGANPTGSFKDRGMAMVTTMAKHYGLEKLVVPTQGNAGDSLSEYAHQFGLHAAVIMPDDTPMPIMGKVAAYSARYAHIEMDLVKGTIREAAALMKQKYLPHGFFNCATFQEPGWRIEGKKTMGLELAEPITGSKQWQLPDVVLYPTGGGTGILGMWKAFDELEQLGVIDGHRPRIIAVQSEANSPVVDAMQQNQSDSIATNGGDTLAVGLNVPGGVGHKAVLKILRASEGAGITVSEQEIANTTREVFQTLKLWISPEGAASIAALTKAHELGLVTQSSRIVCFNTGSAEKYWPKVRHLFQ